MVNGKNGPHDPFRVTHKGKSYCIPLALVLQSNTNTSHNDALVIKRVFNSYNVSYIYISYIVSCICRFCKHWRLHFIIAWPSASKCKCIDYATVEGKSLFFIFNRSNLI